MILIYLFAISLCVVFGMIFLKVFENSRKKLTRFSAFIASHDEITQERIHRIVDWSHDFSQNSQVFIKEKLPQQTKYFFLLIKKQIGEKYQSLLLNARGNRSLRSGNTSPFLQDIAKHKKENGGGRIEEDMLD